MWPHSVPDCIMWTLPYSQIGFQTNWKQTLLINIWVFGRVCIGGICSEVLNHGSDYTVPGVNIVNKEGYKKDLWKMHSPVQKDECLMQMDNNSFDRCLCCQILVLCFLTTYKMAREEAVKKGTQSCKYIVAKEILYHIPLPSSSCFFLLGKKKITKHMDCLDLPKNKLFWNCCFLASVASFSILLLLAGYGVHFPKPLQFLDSHCSRHLGFVVAVVVQLGIKSRKHLPLVHSGSYTTCIDWFVGALHFCVFVYGTSPRSNKEKVPRLAFSLYSVDCWVNVTNG